ncbi:MAG: tetratricopeptide repeat protein [Saprospiraceae bacterium]
MKYCSLLFILALLLSNCDERAPVKPLSNEVLLSFVLDSKNANEGIRRIDSLLNSNPDFSITTNGLLYNEKANYLIKNKEYFLAILNAEKALNIFESIGLKKNVAISYNILGNANTYLDKLEVGDSQINKALKIFIDIDDKRNQDAALNSLSYVMFKLGNYNKSIAYLEKSILIKQETKDNEDIGGTYNNIGYVYEEMKNNVLALEYYLKAVEYDRINRPKTSNSQRNLGMFYLKNKNVDESISLYNEAIVIETITNNLLIQIEILDVLLDSISIDKVINRDVAVNYSRKLPLYEKQRKETQQSLEKQKEAEIVKQVEDHYTLVSSKKELIQEKKDNRKNQIIFLSIIGLFLLAGGLLYQRIKMKYIKEKHEKLVLEQRILRAQMNPHFIFNALTSIQKRLLDDDILQSSKSLSKFAKLIRQNFEFTSKSLISLEEDLESLENYIETQQMRYEGRFDYKIKIKSGLDLLSISIPPMLLQPFVENAIEHGLKAKKEKGNLNINISKCNNHICFEIMDDGVGYQSKMKDESREHATDIFFRRLKLRNLSEEKSFTIMPLLENGTGTKVAFTLKL